MRNFSVFTAIFAAMFFAVSCGSSSNNDEKTDTGETVTDEDTADTGSTDTEPTGDTEPDDTEQEPDDEKIDENDDDYVIRDDSDSGIDDTDNSGNDDDDTGNKCELDLEIFNGSDESYFAFKGIGKIQESGSGDWNQDYVKIKFDGIDGKTEEIAEKRSVFWKEKDKIRIIVRDNPDSGNKFTTNIVSDVQIPRIKNLMENNVFDETIPPDVSFYDWIWTKNHDYLKYCLIADSKFGYNPDYDAQTRVGKLQVCYEDNIDFSVGETFKVAFFAELVTGQDLLDDHDVDSAEELCWCQDAKTWDEVGCSEISWD